MSNVQYEIARGPRATWSAHEHRTRLAGLPLDSDLAAGEAANELREVVNVRRKPGGGETRPLRRD
ncbi:MAG: hypothetical protein ACRD21_05475, partial [Vicinamibacteria bacterium]